MIAGAPVLAGLAPPPRRLTLVRIRPHVRFSDLLAAQERRERRPRLGIRTLERSRLP